jgi:hypothetical protein
VTTLVGLSLLIASRLYIARREVTLANPGDDLPVAARTNIPADTDQRIEPDFEAVLAEDLSPRIARGDWSHLDLQGRNLKWR